MSRDQSTTRDLKSDAERQQRLILQALECTLAGAKVAYVSGPITTGPRFLDWLRVSNRQTAVAEKDSSSLRSSVVEPNEREILEFARQFRVKTGQPIIEPASLRVSGWTQAEYHRLWSRVIERYVGRLIVLPGWQYSVGCVVEFGIGVSKGIRIEDDQGNLVSATDALRRIRAATVEFENAGAGDQLKSALVTLERFLHSPGASRSASVHETPMMRKDESLDRLAELINVAQFVSFSPGTQLRQEYSRLRDRSPNHRFSGMRSAIEELISKSSGLSVNVRSFKPDSPQSHEFVYGLTTVDAAVAAAERLTAQGLHIIVNETIDIHDGGVSGVVLGDLVEFAPDDTPRCVEKPGVASFPRSLALSILTTVYRFLPEIDLANDVRLEFSLHPLAVGWRFTHTLGWELESTRQTDIQATLSWPNRFSRFLGDKAFGLLVADSLGLRIPKTTVFNRRIAPFTFGQSTGSSETWLRTCPTEQVPGKFTTNHGWLDPFKIMNTEDPEGRMISSVLAQSSVPAAFSGAAIVGNDGELIVEGKRGEGESLMLGLSPHEPLPDNIRADVHELYKSIYPILGPVRFEWVHDGSLPWIVQLHRGATQTSRGVIVPGDADRWRHFDLSGGLGALREQLSQMAPGEGILINREVGLTSHIADVLRKANFPARVHVENK